MAQKKVKKITADSKTTDSQVADLRTLSPEKLQERLKTARADLLAMQKSLKANELANPNVVKKTRREIARILTIITEVKNNAAQPEKEEKK